MKVLMLSTDASILEERTEARARMAEYAGLFEELRLVVVTTRNIQYPISNIQKIGNLFLYNTNSSNKLLALWDAYKISKSIIGNWKLEIGNSVITVQDPFELGLVGYLLKRKFGAPLQLQVHTDFLSPYFWHESLKNKIRVLMAKWLLPRVDGMRVVSERIKKSLDNNVRLPRADKGTGPRNDRAVVLPIFVDTDKIKNAPVKADLHKKYPQFDFIILMASRLSREKNIGMAVEAMANLYNANYAKTYANDAKKFNSGLIIVGDGPEKEKLKSVIARNNDESLRGTPKQSYNIILENWADDLASYYKTADLFLLTSLYEGYGRTIVEAMAAGLPIIMTDVGVAGDLVKDGQNGYVIDVGDRRGLVERVSKLIEHADLRKKFSDNNLEAIKNLPSKEEYLRKYKEALEIMTNF